MSDKETKNHEPQQEEQENTQENEPEVDEVQVWKERCTRISADFENFKRRVEKERVRWMQLAQGDLMQDLLTVLDNFERALQQGDDKNVSPEMKTWLDGFSMIGQSLAKMLQKHGLEEVTQNETFDPNLHEAVAQIDSPEHKSGYIVDVLQKGYRLKDQILRPAKVTVAK